MLLNVGEYIGIILFLAAAIHRSTSFTTVALYENCGKDYTVQAGLLSLDKHRLKIDGSDSSFLSRCSVTFQASDVDTDLFYEFTEASINSFDVTIEIYTSSLAFLGLTPTRLYTTFNPPRINDEIRGDRYIRVSVTKVASSDYSAEILVYAEDNHDLSDVPILQVWVIACIVVFCIIFVVIVAVVIACICQKSHGSSGRVVAATGPVHITTATVTQPGQYGYSYPPGAVPPPPSYNQLELQPLPSQASPYGVQIGNGPPPDNYTHTK